MFRRKITDNQKEFNGFAETYERLDLLALGKEGNIVIKKKVEMRKENGSLIRNIGNGMPPAPGGMGMTLLSLPPQG